MFRSPTLGAVVVGVLASLALPAPALAQETQPSTPPAPASDPAPADPAHALELEAVDEMILEGDYAGADARLTQLRSKRPDDPALLVQHGEVLLALDRAAEARPLLERGAELAPARDRAQFQLGAALQRLGEKEPAVQAFGRALEHTRDDTLRRMAHLNRYVLFDELKRWPDAAAELEAVLQMTPVDAQLFGELATVHLKAGDTTAAAAALSRGAEAGFRSAEHDYSLGARLYRDGSYEAAVTAFQRTLENDPTHARAERSLGACYERLGRGAEAAKHWRRYLELAPQAADAKQIAERIRGVESGKPPSKK